MFARERECIVVYRDEIFDSITKIYMIISSYNSLHLYFFNINRILSFLLQVSDRSQFTRHK